MPQAVNTSVENNFVEGLKTEFTGLNFPENACTATSNCVFTLIGDVFRREGIDYEANYALTNINRSGVAISSYIWTNVGGDGQTKVYVLQVGGTLYFYQLTNATASSPLSTTKLASTVTLSSFLATGSTANPNITECQYTDGNGYLFIFHPNLDPFYCTFAVGVVTANIINIQIRDFAGIFETSVADNFRPPTLSAEHNYNLINQGWTSGATWTATSQTNVTVGLGSKTFITQTGLTISNGSAVSIGGINGTSMGGVVTTYTSGTGTLIVNVTSSTGSGTLAPWTLSSTNTNNISVWFTAIGNYPSNSDVWWQFKSSAGAFSPGTTINNITLGTGPAPKGFNILLAFNQQRTSISSVLGLTDVVTTVRPRTGTWFQGRVFYTGVDASQVASGDATFTTWTENIYFSQIIQSNNTSQFGKCYQLNDPTSETLFDLLPSDGGVITIQGCGSIYKLFPVQNGLLVFASNGIWFITGSQGIGFSATDYTITKISGIQSISSTSYVNVKG